MAESDKKFESTKEVLQLIGLGQDEIETFFQLTGRGPVKAGEIALLLDIPEERAVTVAKNLLEKGLVREIPGANPFYIALPPYSALLNQIQNFKEVVEKIQESTPKALQLKFKEIEEHSAKLGKFNEYRNFINIMKTNLPAQVKTQFSKVENELENVKRFQEIRAFILNLREIAPEEVIKEFDVVETRLEKIKSEISVAFEKQFRIGALKNMAEKIVSKIITEQFSDLTDYFREKFVTSIRGTLDQVTEQLASISDVAGEMSVDLSNFLDEIVSGLEETMEDLDGRIATVYEDVDKGIEELKGMFQSEIYKTLEKDIMTNILLQLDLSERTMTEFWERSKETSMLTFKDVWFVRSAEGMKAQINEALTRVKAKFHIITPKLADIDIVAVTKVKKFVNIRISTNFDYSNPKDQAKLAEILKYPNVQVRLYNRENLYSLNRDFEEICICAVSKNEFGGLEIAGMGSVLPEHVKLFAPLVEDVWIQSKKIGDDEIRYSIGVTPGLPTTEQPLQQPTFTMPETPQVSGQPISQPEPIQSFENNHFSQPSTPFQPEISKQPSIPETPTMNPQIEPYQPIQPTQPAQPSGLAVAMEGTVSELFDAVLNNLDKKLSSELSDDLEYLRTRISEDIGYASILNPMSITIATLRSVPNLLSSMEIEDIRKKIDFWRNKINV